MKKKIYPPVPPTRMEIILIYNCPNCKAPVPVLAPTSPIKVICNNCSTEYPVLPADAKTIQYINLMLANGSALVNPNFL